jgi:5'-3' exonuclease
LSSDQEGGEGEHKIMRLLRERPNQKSPIFVYGLDADLILLTLLNSPCEAYLMREDAEMGVPNTDIFGEESYSYFSLEVLKKAIFGERAVEVPHEEILEYVAAMSFLGNDFLPHSLSIKIREDGHNFLLSELKEMKRQQKSLLQKEEGLWKIQYQTVEWLLQRWCSQEEDRLTHSFKKKMQMRSNVEINLDTKPLEDPVEQKILQVYDKVWSLKKGWQTVYKEEWLMCKTQPDIDMCCREYLVGLQWILNYYTGQKEVDMTWYYPRLVPPLWHDIYKYLQSKKEIPEPQASKQKPIQPEEQLVMVLPLQSWHYIPTTSPYRLLPSEKPQYWPSKFGFFTAGRIRMWECEPLLPVLPVHVLRMRSTA